jgi:hypothetical protein
VQGEIHDASRYLNMSGKGLTMRRKVWSGSRKRKRSHQADLYKRILARRVRELQMASARHPNAKTPLREGAWENAAKSRVADEMDNFDVASCSDEDPRRR